MKLKIAQYGVGKMSKFTMRYCLEKGWEIIGAFDNNPQKYGVDISEIMELDKPLGVKIDKSTDFEQFLLNKKPDIVIVTTMSLFKDVYECLHLCAKYGVNAITTCEEAFYPQNSNPSLFEELDDLCKKTNCTITGSGYQDIFWGNLIASIAGSTHKITKILGKSSYNVEDYGIALARAHGAGLTTEQFEKEIASADEISDEERENIIKSGEYAPSYMWNVNGWLASKLGLHITHQTQKCIPQIAKQDLHSTTLGMDVKKGMVTGMSAVVTSKTEEGVVLETQCIGKVYASDEFDSNEWTIVGEPSTTIVVNEPNTVELTCATTVNRIPDVIEAPAGYITTDHFGLPQYKTNIENLK